MIHSGTGGRGRARRNRPPRAGDLDKFIQEPWYRDPAGYRAFAEKYYVEVKPMLVKAGLAKS